MQRRNRRSLFPLVALSMAIALPLRGEAAVKVISTRKENRPSDSNCGRTQTCDLKSVRFIEMKKRVEFPNEPLQYASYMSDIAFGYTVDPKEQIEGYGIVQFIRGCMFESYLINGKIQKYLTVTRQHFGRSVTFQHKRWEIDSDSTDPLYSSHPDYGRFSLLRWNTDPGSLSPASAIWYENQKPPHGSVFITDLPGSAALMPGGTNARNTSLEFRTCIFKKKDLPVSTDPQGSNIDPSDALWCVEWDHKFVWDFKTGRMQRPKSIDAICQVQ